MADPTVERSQIDDAFIAEINAITSTSVRSYREADADPYHLRWE